VLVDPFECLVDEAQGGIAARRLRAVDSGGPSFAVTGGVGLCAAVRLVEGIGVEIWRLSLAWTLRRALGKFSGCACR
jgi:hypothetical protein